MGQRRTCGSGWCLTTRWGRLAWSSIDAALSILFDPECAICARPLERPTEGTVCPPCWHSILPLTPPLCDQCGDPLPTWRATGLSTLRCARCRRLPRHVDRARAIGAYDGALRAVVHALKYEGRRSLARPLGALMRARGSDLLAAAEFAVPVPLHAERRRARGFNQADDLAQHLGLPVLRCLRRTRPTAVQAELPAARRHGNVKGAFVISGAADRVRGRVAVLVDDVSTTGATLDACALALKNAGATTVLAITAARVPTRPR